MRMHRTGGGGGGAESGIPGKSQAIWVSVIGPSPEKVGSPGSETLENDSIFSLKLIIGLLYSDNIS